MGKFVDLTGQVFERLTVLSKCKYRSSCGGVIWTCRCTCGTIKDIASGSIVFGKTKSCGCLKREVNFVDLTGQVFERLTVLSKTEYRESTGGIIWKCRCICGTIKDIASGSLVSGNTKSCGCIQKEVNSERCVVDLSGKTFERLTVLGESENRTNGGGVIWKCRCTCGLDKDVASGSLVSGKTKSCGCLNRELSIDRGLKRVQSYRESKGHHKDFCMTDNNMVMRGIFKPLSKLCKERDKFTCILCKQIGGHLHTHHIETWSNNPALRFEQKNLVTLCTTCHKDKVHQGKTRGPTCPKLTKKLHSYIKRIYKNYGTSDQSGTR